MENFEMGQSVEQLEKQHVSTTFSIEAEDMMVERIFYHMLNNRHDHIGFYVDLGAFDPIKHSNTYRFYKRGWRGINVEVNPEAIQRFKLMRPEDTTLNVAIGPEGQTGQYLQFAEPLLNGFLDEQSIKHHRDSGMHVLASHPVDFVSVNSLLEKYVPPGVKVDYLNIDIETMEHYILAEWDFTRFAPAVIAVEIHGFYSVTDIATTPVAQLLKERGYTFVSRLWHTSIFARLT